MKTIVKIAGIAVPLALQAHATTTFSPNTTSAVVSTIAQTGAYIQHIFSFGLSRNTGLAYNEDGAGVYAQAGNTKGSVVFGAATTGGGVTPCPQTVSVNTSTGYSGTPSAGGSGCS